MNLYFFVVGFWFFIPTIFLFDLPFPQRLRKFGAFVPGPLSSGLSCLYKLGCSRQWSKLNKKTANYKVPMFGCFGAKCDENYAN